MAICGAQALVAGVARDLQLAFLYDSFALRGKAAIERRPNRAGESVLRMIKVQMRADHGGDIAQFHPDRAQMVGQPSVVMEKILRSTVAQAVADSAYRPGSRRGRG